MPLNAIAPDGSVGSAAHGNLLVQSRLSRLFKRLRQLWNRTKISRLGSYSTERRETLDEYTQNTSWMRVLLVYFSTPLPALLLAIILECIPLQDPMAGWKANFGAWIRLGVFLASAALGSLFQIRDAIPELSRWRILCIGLGTGCGATLPMVALAAVWTFPLPFGIALASFSFQLAFGALLMGSIRRGGLNTRLKCKLFLIVAQSVLALAYVTFSIIFARCTSKQQFGLLVLLPVMKLAFKHLVAWLAADDKEKIPAVVVFTVDLFNGLYVSSCIQSSQSWSSSILMITLNVGRTLFSLWDIYRGARELTATDNLGCDKRCGNGKLQKLESNKRHPVELTHSVTSQGRVAPPSIDPRHCSVNPIIDLPRMQGQSGSTLSDFETKPDRHSHKMLFHLEYLVLVEYVESVIPTLYVIYLLVLVQLPSAQYYPHTRHISSSQLHASVGSIILYAAVEVLSMLWLHVVLRRKFGFSLLYQLAFILETEKGLLQGRLFVWITPLLQITLVHFGKSMASVVLLQSVWQFTN
jgi:hypothetical protein